MTADPKELLRTIVDECYMELNSDLGGCAYYQRCIGTPGFSDGICSFGCQEEPECITCEPTGGWPSQREGYDYATAWFESFWEMIEANYEPLRPLH